MHLSNNPKRELHTGMALLAAFVLWTALVQLVDVQPAGVHGTNIGFATLNVWFHHVTDVHMGIYTLTDWLGLVPIAVCLSFGVMGAIQLVTRRSLFKVDADLLALGVYYVIVIFAYLLFETLPINYRPILIDGVMEASYPSSTTLLVLSVMPTLMFQTRRRTTNPHARRIVAALVVAFSVFMVAGRLVSGVHWLTDIVGSALLAPALFMLYRFAVSAIDGMSKPTQAQRVTRSRDAGEHRKEQGWNSTRNSKS